MRASAAAFALVCAASALWAAPTSAQCVVSYEAEFENGIGALSGSSRVVTKGTFNCGVVSGTVCGSGNVDGSCLASTATSRVVSCEGRCQAVYGGRPADVTCDGKVDWVGGIRGSCLSGACTFGGTGDDGTSTTTVAATDPASLAAAAPDCMPGGPGVHRATFVGVTTIPVATR